MTLSFSSCLMVPEHEKRKKDAQIPHRSPTRRPPSVVTGGEPQEPCLLFASDTKSASLAQPLALACSHFHAQETKAGQLPVDGHRYHLGKKSLAGRRSAAFQTKGAAIASEQRLTTRRFHLFSCSLYLFC